MTLQQWVDNGWLRTHRTSKKGDAKYLDICRSKRNTAEYEYVGAVTETEAEALISFARELKEEVISWLKKQHPQLLDD